VGEEGRFTGNAAKGIEKRLKELGFKIIVSPSSRTWRER